MIFQVCSRYGDTCGNKDMYHHSYVEASSKEEVEKVYPRGFFVGFRVFSIDVIPLPTEIQKPGKEP
jgi:hypothetical protein